MSRYRLIPVFTLALLCFLKPLAAIEADEWCESSPSDCVKVGTWDISVGLGAGLRTNPVAGSDDIPLIVLPSISYYGKRLYFENLNFGYQLLESERYDFNVILTPGRDHLYFNRWSLGNFSLDGSDATATAAFVQQPITGVNNPNSGDGGFVPDGQQQEDSRDIDDIELNSRRLSVLAGFDVHHYYKEVSLGFQFLKDVRGVHNGYEIRGALSHSSIAGKSVFSSALGFIWQDSKTLDYYYGTQRNEVPDSSLVYQADAGFSPFVRFDWDYSLTEKWSLKTTAYYRSLPSAIKDSPIVDDNGVATVFFGGIYHF